MEQEQSRRQIQLSRCWFNDFCLVKNQQTCSVCQDKGLHYLVDKLFIDRTMIPKRYLFQRFEDLVLNKETFTAGIYLDNLRDMVDEGKGMYAYSQQTGTGKTTICCIALIRCLAYSLERDPYDPDNRRSLYINTSEFLDRIRKSFSVEDMELQGLLEELSDINRAPKLVLFDDIGSETSTEWARERLYNLLNFRSANGLASLFTSNYSLDQLEARLGSRIVSRIIGCARPIHFKGGDNRECVW